MIQKIGTRWLDFVGSLAHILHRCRPGLIPVYGSSFCKEINIESEKINQILELIKQKEAEGFSYDTALASFELLVRRHVGQPIWHSQ